MNKDIKPCVYTITNAKDKVRYIGSTRDFSKRVDKHLQDLGSGNHQNVNLQKAYDNDAEFSFAKVAEFENYEDAFHFENILIAEFIETGMLYNICGGNNPYDTYTHHPDKAAVIKKRTASIKKTYANMTPEERRLRWDISGEKNPMYGKTHTDENKEKFRQRMLGNTPPNKGKPMPKGQYDAMCVRMRESADTMKGEGNHFYGKHHSDKTKQYLSELFKGRMPANSVKVSIEGIVYDSINKAAEALTMISGTVRHRVRSNNPLYSEWKTV